MCPQKTVGVLKCAPRRGFQPGLWREINKQIKIGSVTKQAVSKNIDIVYPSSKVLPLFRYQ